ncbi:MAG: hypothetical protein EHM19_10910 [Candidatus Latescibacterota bacterium]|nr:MAG: hypothetical protein EHM19_10910 [Candidatus Latescibacterota bacterium]
MRSTFIGVLLFVVLIIACSRSDDRLIAFSFSPAEPAVTDKLAIRYDPEASRSPLNRSDSVDFRFTLVGPGGEVHTDAIPMERKGGEWRARLRPADSPCPSPVLMLSAFVDSEDPEICDCNEGDPWVIQFYENGTPARGSEFQLYRLCSGEIRLPRHLGVPTGGGKGLGGLDAELAAHPDHLPARAAQWKAALGAISDSAEVPDSLRLAIRGELDAIFEMNLRGDEPDTSIAPFLEFYQLIGAEPKAESLLAEMRLRFPDTRFVSRCEFYWAFAPDDVEPALARLQDLVQRYPDSPEAGKARGFLFMIYDNVMGMPEKAEELVRGGGPLDHWHLRRYARMLVDQEQFEKAEETARRCVREAEADKWPDTGLTTRREWESEHAETLRSYRVFLAWILGERGSYEEAVAVLEPIVETMADAGDRIGLGNLAEYQAELGRKSEALATYDRLGESALASEEALGLWRTVYSEVHGSDEGFDAHLAVLDEKRAANRRRLLDRRVLDWPAPDVTLTDMDGSPHRLSEFRGKVVVLDFWATWCGPCLQSLPQVEEVARSLEADAEVAVIALNTWERGTIGERRAAIEEKWTELGLSLPIYLDMANPDDTESHAADLFHVPSIPSSFIIDRDGRILFRGGGLFDQDDIVDVRLKIDYALSRQALTSS